MGKTRKPKNIEIFDPRDGRTLKVVRYEWQAQLICKFIPALDYARNYDYGA